MALTKVEPGDLIRSTMWNDLIDYVQALNNQAPPPAKPDARLQLIDVNHVDEGTVIISYEISSSTSDEVRIAATLSPEGLGVGAKVEIPEETIKLPAGIPQQFKVVIRTDGIVVGGPTLTVVGKGKDIDVGDVEFLTVSKQ